MIILQTSNRLPDPDRHIKKKKLRDISRKIRKVELRLRNKKSKGHIPQLQTQLIALNKEYDEILRGNFQRPARKAIEPRLCPVCHGGIGKGYHICKPILPKS